MSETRLPSFLGSDAGDWGEEGRKSSPGWDAMAPSSVPVYSDIGPGPGLWGISGKGMNNGAGHS